jgi:hypothetical protein
VKSINYICLKTVSSEKDVNVRSNTENIEEGLYTLGTGSWDVPGSSGSIVSGYGLDDQAIEVRSPAGAKDFPSNLCLQTGSGAHPASCTMGTGGPFPGQSAARA